MKDLIGVWVEIHVRPGDRDEDRYTLRHEGEMKSREIKSLKHTLGRFFAKIKSRRADELEEARERVRKAAEKVGLEVEEPDPGGPVPSKLVTY